MAQYSVLFLGILYERDVYCYLSFIDEKTKRLGKVSKRLFFFPFPNNSLDKTLLCKLLATLISVCKILCDLIQNFFIYLSFYLSNLVPSIFPLWREYKLPTFWSLSHECIFHHQLKMCWVYSLWESVISLVNTTLYFHFIVFTRINWNNKKKYLSDWYLVELWHWATKLLEKNNKITDSSRITLSEQRKHLSGELSLILCEFSLKSNSLLTPDSMYCFLPLS